MESLQALKACVLPLHYARNRRKFKRASPPLATTNKILMAKGISSGNSLKALAHPLQRFLAGWGSEQRPARAEAAAALPPVYALAVLRGEGVLRERFFQHFMQKLPIEVDATQQLDLWNTLIEDGGTITAWVQRLGIAKAVRREAIVPADLAQESRTLYALLLDALATQAPALLPNATEGYFLHCWRAQFPQTSHTVRKTTPAEVLRERLLRALRKRHSSAAVELKESFQEVNDAVTFALLFRLGHAGRWQELIKLERPRLRTARFAAYEAALEGLAGDLLD